MKKLLILYWCLMVFSCSGNKDKQGAEIIEPTFFTSGPEYNTLKNTGEKKGIIGKYVYLDKNSCLHIKNGCLAKEIYNTEVLVTTLNDEASLSLASAKYATHRVLLSELKEADLFYCCDECVSDSLYDELRKRIGRVLEYNPVGKVRENQPKSRGGRRSGLNIGPVR